MCKGNKNRTDKNKKRQIFKHIGNALRFDNEQKKNKPDKNPNDLINNEIHIYHRQIIQKNVRDMTAGASVDVDRSKMIYDNADKKKEDTNRD
jgi:hypothetical protein